VNPRLSVVLSFRNEAAVLPELLRRLRASLDPLGHCYELIFVDDASNDGSAEYLEGLVAPGSPVRVLTTSRRFGVSECVLLGFEHARGDAVVYMDTDLQDPPELIPGLLAKFEQGADVVHTVRTSRQGESRLKVWLTRRAYGLIRASSEIDLPVEAGDFKLLSRRVVRELLALRESRPYLRGLVCFTGFRQETLTYAREARGAGASHFPVLGSRGPLFTLLAGLTSFSLLPPLLVLAAGLASLGLALLACLGLLAGQALGAAGGAAAWLAALLVGCTGAQLVGVGIAGFYAGRALEEARGRPRAILAKRRGFADD
jgi:dolichol-phosphate mannosyltransferase